MHYDDTIVDPISHQPPPTHHPSTLKGISTMKRNMIILGFDISELSWNAFTPKSMFDPHWYLRPARLVIYTVTMAFATAAQCAATYPYFKYKFLRNHIEAFSMHTAHVFNNDITAAAILSMVFPGVLQLIFTIEYFSLLFWPKRMYPRWYNVTKKWIFMGIMVGMTATVGYSTAVISTRSAIISGVDEAKALQYTQLYFRPPLKYHAWPQNIAWLVLLWITVVLNVFSVILLHMAIYHHEKYGIQPKQTQIPDSENEDKQVTGQTLVTRLGT